MAKDCNTCRFAKWNLTANGRKHPNKSGHCAYAWVPPRSGDVPRPSGGYIERGSNAYQDCSCWSFGEYHQGIADALEAAARSSKAIIEAEI